MKRFRETIKQSQGQSLVEAALILPILLLLIAGLVEFSNLVITQNRVSSAARASARFGANGGEDEGMILVAINTVTQTLDLDPQRWDIWTVRGEVNDAGTNFTDFSIVHSYGMSQTAKFTETQQSIISGTIQSEVLYRLQVEADGSDVVTNTALAANEKFVGTLVLYDTQFILGLDDLFELVESAKTIRQLHLMNKPGLEIETTNGCDGVFPIGVEEGIRSVLADNYPPPEAFDWPNPAPPYEQFIVNIGFPDTELQNAREGHLFYYQFGSDSAKFSWLKWRLSSPDNGATLNTSLTWPGNSHSVSDGFQDYDDIRDTTMHVDDRVSLNRGNDIWGHASIATTIRNHIDNKRYLRLPTWLEGNNDGNAIRIHGFAVFRIRGYHFDSLTPTNSWLLLEFMRWDTSCGQTTNP